MSRACLARCLRLSPCVEVTSLQRFFFFSVIHGLHPIHPHSPFNPQKGVITRSLYGLHALVVRSITHQRKFSTAKKSPKPPVSAVERGERRCVRRSTSRTWVPDAHRRIVIVTDLDPLVPLVPPPGHVLNRRLHATITYVAHPVSHKGALIALLSNSSWMAPPHDALMTLSPCRLSQLGIPPNAACCLCCLLLLLADVLARQRPTHRTGAVAMVAVWLHVNPAASRRLTSRGATGAAAPMLLFRMGRHRLMIHSALWNDVREAKGVEKN